MSGEWGDYPAEALMAGNFTYLDLFCGAGGLSAGLGQAGLTCTLAVDFNEPAIQSHRASLGGHAVVADVATIEPLSAPPSLVVGGPPCQGFSSAGSRKTGDRRNTLVGTFARFVAHQRPTAFVFENVEGFLTGERGARVLELLEPVIEAGYWVHLRKVNLAAYGVPQLRKRVIALGGLGWDPGFPSETHSAFGAPGARNFGASTLPPSPTLRDAIGDLPAAVPGGSVSPSDHILRVLSEDDQARAEALAPGMTMRDLPEHLWHKSYRRRAYRRVKDGTPTERRGGAPAGLRRLRWDEPSKAITSGAPSEFLHPAEHRPLTLRECARIQTFPDSFEFFGTKSQKALQIGNAIPPRFGAVLGRHLQRVFEERPKRLEGGRLLSFVPTPSGGMSPALRHTTRLVEAWFDPRVTLTTVR